MPKVRDNIIVAAVPDPKTCSIAVRWANGETTSSGFHHLVGKGV